MPRLVWVALAVASVAGCVPEPDPNHICSQKTLDKMGSGDGHAIYYTSFSPSRLPFVVGEQATLTVRAHSSDRRGQCIVDPRALHYQWKLFGVDDRPVEFSTNADHSVITFIAPEEFVWAKLTVSHAKWGKDATRSGPFPVCTKEKIAVNTC